MNARRWQILLTSCLMAASMLWLLSAKTAAGSSGAWLSGILSAGNIGRPLAARPVARSIPLWLAMHERLKTRAAQGNVGLLFLGDSITQGMDGVQDLLQQNWGQYQPANFGIGGDGTQHLLWRLQHGETKGLQPRLAVILIGTNNLGDSHDRDIVTGVKEVVEELHKQLPQTKVLVLGILPRAQLVNDPLRGRVGHVNSGLAKLADGKTTFYVDIGDKLIERDGSISPEVMSDFLHPTRRGYQLMFEAIKPTVDKLLAS
jgi:lysophospholipase L1-like esterase